LLAQEQSESLRRKVSHDMNTGEFRDLFSPPGGTPSKAGGQTPAAGDVYSPSDQFNSSAVGGRNEDVHEVQYANLSEQSPPKVAAGPNSSRPYTENSPYHNTSIAPAGNMMGGMGGGTPLRGKKKKTKKERMSTLNQGNSDDERELQSGYSGNSTDTSAGAGIAHASTKVPEQNAAAQRGERPRPQTASAGSQDGPPSWTKDTPFNNGRQSAPLMPSRHTKQVTLNRNNTGTSSRFHYEKQKPKKDSKITVYDAVTGPNGLMSSIVSQDMYFESEI